MRARIERLERKIGQAEWKCVTVRQIAPGVYVHSLHGYPVRAEDYDHLVIIELIENDD